jgi:hypothetical protein
MSGSSHSDSRDVGYRSGLVPAAAALGLPSLGAILFLRADKAQPAAMLTDNPGPFDAFLESSKQLIERLRILDLNPHA